MKQPSENPPTPARQLNKHSYPTQMLFAMCFNESIVGESGVEKAY